MSSTYAVVMAGGIGKRLQPLGSEDRPKQFLSLLGERTMLQATVDRILPLVSLDHVIVVTGARYEALVCSQLPDLPSANVVSEPVARGTAACIGLAALHIVRENPEAVMLALPADHFIRDEVGFRRVLVAAAAAAAGGEHLVTLGIEPDEPSPEYGYMEAGSHCEVESTEAAYPIRRVKQFTEKPDRETAAVLIQTGCAYWNSGIFAWRADRILREIREKMSALGEALDEIAVLGGPSKSASSEVLRLLKPLISSSIDTGVLEKSDCVVVVPAGRIGWSDVGSFESLRELRQCITKPWGYEELWALTPDYAAKVLHIKAGRSSSLQLHVVKEETVRVVTGSLRLRWGYGEEPTQECILNPGDRFHICPGMTHQMEATSDCEVLEVSTPHLLDVVRLEPRASGSGK